MFDSLSYADQFMVYEGLFSLVTSNSGIGFANADQGHPAYVMGSKGVIDYEAWGDHPDRNRLFQMMHQLSVSLNEHESDRPTTTEYVFAWSDFCRIAVEAYNNQRKKEEG
jgi:hypothetical protein